MSRKLILTLATAATIAASALASTAADARGFGGGGGGFGGGRGGFGGGGFARVGGFGGGHFGGVGRVGRISAFHFSGHNLGHFQHWQHWSHWHPHHRWFWRDGRWFYGDDYVGGDYAQPVAAYLAPAVSTPGPCTCLTKSYTQDGMVVFADLCTKESAAAPVDGRAADATPPQAPSGPPAPPAEDKASDAAPMQNPSNFAGRTYKDFLAANGLPMPQGK